MGMEHSAETNIHAVQFYDEKLEMVLDYLLHWLRNYPRDVRDVAVARDRDDDWLVTVYWREE